MRQRKPLSSRNFPTPNPQIRQARRKSQRKATTTEFLVLSDHSYLYKVRAEPAM
jgi:hypothetical protein